MLRGKLGGRTRIDDQRAGGQQFRELRISESGRRDEAANNRRTGLVHALHAGKVRGRFGLAFEHAGHEIRFGRDVEGPVEAAFVAERG